MSALFAPKQNPYLVGQTVTIAPTGCSPALTGRITALYLNEKGTPMVAVKTPAGFAQARQSRIV